MSAVRSKLLTRRAFWADPTIHYFSQVAVESREGSEELTIAQAHYLGGPDNSFDSDVMILSQITQKQRQGLHLAILLLIIIRVCKGSWLTMISKM